MRRKQEKLRPDELGAAIREFSEWRSHRTRGERIPEVLWRSAISVASVRGVSETSRALRLDYYALKKRVTGDTAIGLTKASTQSTSIPKGHDDDVQFLEVSLASEKSTGACALEVERTLGEGGASKLRLEFESVALQDLESLLRSVWSDGR